MNENRFFFPIIVTFSLTLLIPSLYKNPGRVLMDTSSLESTYPT